MRKKMLPLFVTLTSLTIMFFAAGCDNGKVDTTSAVGPVVNPPVIVGSCEKTTCTDPTYKIVYDTTTKECTCEAPLTPEETKQCSAKTCPAGQYPFTYDKASLPAEADPTCRYYEGCRANTTVGSDFNGDGFDDIAVGAPLAKVPNESASVVTSIMNMFHLGSGVSPETNYAGDVGGSVHLMLMKNWPELRAADPDPQHPTTANLTQIKISSEETNGRPYQILGMVTRLKDIDGDRFADLIFTATDTKGSGHKVYILFGTDKLFPKRDYRPSELIGQDKNKDGKIDMMEIYDFKGSLVYDATVLKDEDKTVKLAIGFGGNEVAVFSGAKIKEFRDYAITSPNQVDDSSIDKKFADKTIAAPEGSGYTGFGEKMVGVDINQDGKEELASEITIDSTKYGIGIFDVNTGARTAFMMLNVINNNPPLISMAAANVNRATTDTTSVPDDLIVGISPNFGVEHMVGIILGKTNIVLGDYVLDNLATSIKGNIDDHWIPSRCQIDAALGINQKQKDPSSIGTDIAVIPGGAGNPDTLLLSDPTYDLSGFCPADYRMPRICKFPGKQTNFKPEYVMTQDGIQGANSSVVQPCLSLPISDVTPSTIRWWGYDISVIGNINNGDETNSYELLIGSPQEIDFGLSQNLFGLLSKGVGQAPMPVILGAKLHFDLSGSIDFWSNALQGSTEIGKVYYAANQDFTVRPGEGDYLDLARLLNIAGGGGFDLGPLANDIASLINGMLTIKCDGMTTCEEIQTLLNSDNRRTLCQSAHTNNCSWNETALECSAVPNVTTISCSGLDGNLCGSLDGCTYQVSPLGPDEVVATILTNFKIGQFGWSMSE